MVNIDVPTVHMCHNLCSCYPANCDRHITPGRLPYELQIYMNGNGQWSVRTLNDIPAGRFIMELAGEILANDDVAARIAEYRTSHGGGTVWCFTNPSRQWSQPMMAIDPSVYGNASRFLHDACSPNLTTFMVIPYNTLVTNE